jgi:flagellar basal-body rod protein FlgG
MGSIIQGMLEQSNVSVVSEFVNMIAQRAYEACSRVVNAADQMLQTINNLGREEKRKSEVGDKNRQ